jgi:hypothetical protein
LSVSETIAATIIGAPVVAAATPSQAWTEGKAISLALPGGTFTDPQGEKLTYKATLASGQALPSWLTFNAASETFSGTAPGTHQNLSVTVTATNSSGLAVSETISACVAAPPVVAAATGNQTWTEGTKILLALPGGTFSDPQGEKLTYKATLASGQALPSWLTFNAATETFSGTAPASAVTIGITVKATDTSGLSVSESFSAAVQPAATKSVSQPAGGTSAVAAAGDFILQSNVLDGPPMRFLAVETAGGQAGAAAGGTLPFIAPGASGGSISAAELFSIPAAAPWSHPASGSETTFAAATAFDPASVRDLIAFHS